MVDGRGHPKAAATLIELDGVGREFADAESGAPVSALADVSLRIAAGEFVALVGPSGSGKSTLLRILGCLDTPTEGVYRFDGTDVGALDADGRARLRRDAFGFVFQDYSLLDALTAQENVELPALYAGVGRAPRGERAMALLTSLGLAARTRHRPPELSGGEQQRVAVARALMNGGRVILADEPTGALDVAAGEDLVERLAALAQVGHTVVVATHDANVAAKAARRIALRDGRVVEDAAPAAPAAAPPAAPALPPRSGWERTLDAARDAVGALASAWRHRRLGTTLSATSVAVGVWCLLVLAGVLGGAAREGLQASIMHMGADTIRVMRGGLAGIDVEPARFDMADATAIAGVEDVAEVRLSTGGLMSVQAVGGASEAVETRVEAASANAEAQADRPLAAGVFFTAQDSADRAPVAVLGSAAADTLFGPGEPAVGRQVLLAGHPFVVKGVFVPYEAGFLDPGVLAPLYNDDILIPLETGIALLFGDRNIRITVRVAAPARLEDTARRLRDMLAARHDLDSFRLDTSSGSMHEWERVQRTMEAVWATVGAIALLLGGFGMFAVTTMSARSRRREIGLRLAAGAGHRNILRQFLRETAATSLAGAVVGAVASAATLLALARASVVVEISALHMLLAIAGAIAVGMLFGLLPARRAAKLDPATLADAP